MKAPYIISLCASAIFFAGCCSSKKPITASKIAVGDVVAEVQTAISRAQLRLQDSDLPGLESVTLTLETSLSSKVEGGFDLWVIEAGGSRTSERTHSVDIVLEPPKGSAALNARNLMSEGRLVPIHEELENAIVSAFQSLKPRYSASNVVLDVKEVDVTIGLKVSHGASGGISIKPISLKIGGEIGSESSHAIKVTYAKSEKAKLLFLK